MSRPIYQLIASGASSCFNKTNVIASQRLWTRRSAAEAEIESFKAICTKDDGKHIDWIEPSSVQVIVMEFELVDDGLETKNLREGIAAYHKFADGRADDMREDCWWTLAAKEWEAKQKP